MSARPRVSCLKLTPGKTSSIHEQHSTMRGHSRGLHICNLNDKRWGAHSKPLLPRKARLGDKNPAHTGTQPEPTGSGRD